MTRLWYYKQPIIIFCTLDFVDYQIKDTVLNNFFFVEKIDREARA